MKIVIDTNIIVSDPWLTSNNFRILFENFKASGHSFFTPTIVIDEATNKYREKLEFALQALRRNSNELCKLLPLHHEHDQLSIIDLDLEKSTKEYHEYLIQKLNGDHPVSARFILCPTAIHVDHHELVKRALSRRKPFSEKGSGYRDTLIWYGILQTLETYGEDDDQVAFISQNTSDFSNGNGKLHPDLVQDLIDRSFGKDSVVYYENLKQFVQHQVINLFESFEGLKSQLNVGGDQEQWFRNKLLEATSQELKYYKIDKTNSLLPKTFENLEIIKVIELSDYEVTDVRRKNQVRKSYITIDIEFHLVCSISAVLNNKLVSEDLDFSPKSLENIDLDNFRVRVDVLVRSTALSVYYDENEGISLDIGSVVAMKCL
jgi:hypothetical protein